MILRRWERIAHWPDGRAPDRCCGYYFTRRGAEARNAFVEEVRERKHVGGSWIAVVRRRQA